VQLQAVLAVNKELVLLYWHIGRSILERQQAQGWGAKVIDQLATDLHQTFPQMKGFSQRNLKYMRAFAQAGVITFFTPIFPAKQKAIRAEDEKEAWSARICPGNAGKSTPVSRFPKQTVALSSRSGANVP